MKKTVVEAALAFLVSIVLYYYALNVSRGFSSTVLGYFGILFFSIEGLYFVGYYFNKRAYTFYVTEKSLRILKSWIFGTYEREITLDQLRDVHVSQGFFARLFNCGSLMFVSAAGLEVGYGHAGGGVGAGIVFGGVGTSSPVLLKGRGNTFWDIADPSSVRQTLLAKMTQWREVFQQQRVATAVEKIVEEVPDKIKPTTSISLVSELERLNALFEKGALTKAEYEEAKKKLLE